VLRNNKGASVVIFHGLAHQVVKAGLVSKTGRGGYLCQVEGNIDTCPTKKKKYQQYFLKNKEPPTESNGKENEM
jgi:hypothetical protein